RCSPCWATRPARPASAPRPGSAPGRPRTRGWSTRCAPSTPGWRASRGRGRAR
ncbi:MAG: hypothetical protein AVDCRST_MAG66-1027, partial [uncultured Pseudonocardia sp.]